MDKSLLPEHLLTSYLKVSDRFSMLFQRLLRNTHRVCFRYAHYIQGQSPEPKVREYFYYIDHQGQLFLDDARMKNFTSCFKEKKFLEFFFTRLRMNETSRYQEEFPYLSPCGRERNFIRCDDLPVVYVHLTNTQNKTEPDILTYGSAGTSLTVKFEPEKLCMLPETGRVYHPATTVIGGVGLVKSSIAIAISPNFDFTDGEERPPTHFTWKGVKHKLTNELIPLLESSKGKCVSRYDMDEG